MNIIGTIIWLVFGGFFAAIGWAAAGLLCMFTIIGIPFGLQCMKIASLTLLPFGREVYVGQFGAAGLIGNILWILLLGWELFIYHAVLMFLFGITIIGLPFARQHAKLASLALLPFGSEIV